MKRSRLSSFQVPGFCLAGWLVLVAAVMAAVSPCEAAEVEWQLQSRDPETNEIAWRTETVDASKVGLVVVDLWNYHWCMTWAHQVGSAVPRFNEAARAARQLGMQVFWAPSDVANAKVGWEQRERALAAPSLEVPQVRPEFKIPFGVKTGACHCGPGIACVGNHGHDDMPLGVYIAPEDLIVAGEQEMYSNCRALGLTHLIYAGGATNICLTHKPAGLMAMYRAGLECAIARDFSEAWTHYDPKTGHTPETGNEEAVADVERAGVGSLDLEAWFRRLGVWDEQAMVHEVRFSPWGKEDRPYLFDEAVTVTFKANRLGEGEIRYTTDGSTPSVASPLYEKPLVLTETTSLRAAAFGADGQVSGISDGYFACLPALPPKPDLYLDAIKSLPDPYGRHAPVLNACLWHPVANKSYNRQRLRVRGQGYEKGLGMRAPSNARYALKPEYRTFVALVGVDDSICNRNRGRNVAMHSSVVFKVFVDGKLLAQSPVMRTLTGPWGFEVNLPQGARQINLAVTDAGTRSSYDLGNWCQAGFVLGD